VAQQTGGPDETTFNVARRDVLAGCASSPKPVAVRVVDNENLVRGCQVLGTVSDDQLEDLQKKAARIGGNVTLLTPQRKSKGGHFAHKSGVAKDPINSRALTPTLEEG
jgi:hypothetical protein